MLNRLRQGAMVRDFASCCGRNSRDWRGDQHVALLLMLRTCTLEWGLTGAVVKRNVSWVSQGKTLADMG